MMDSDDYTIDELGRRVYLVPMNHAIFREANEYVVSPRQRRPRCVPDRS